MLMETLLAKSSEILPGSMMKQGNLMHLTMSLNVLGKWVVMILCCTLYIERANLQL